MHTVGVIAFWLAFLGACNLMLWGAYRAGLLGLAALTRAWEGLSGPRREWWTIYGGVILAGLTVFAWLVLR